MKIATIDIGTHSALLLIAEKNPDGTVKPLADEAILTRIGEGLGFGNQFGLNGMLRTLKALKTYRALCDNQGVERILAVGTAAFRKARNAAEFVRKVKKECGMSIEIITAEREAELTWKSCNTDFGVEIIVVDVGGGSTEIITQETDNGKSLKIKSLPVGSVILTERLCHSDPISENDFEKMGAAIEKELGQISFASTPNLCAMVATAGTATTLGAIQKKMGVYKHHEIHGLKISLTDIRDILQNFKSKTIEDRKKILGLEPGRADVILAGSLLLEKIAAHFGFKEITVSDRGVRWGLVYEFLQN